MRFQKWYYTISEINENLLIPKTQPNDQTSKTEFDDTKDKLRQIPRRNQTILKKNKFVFKILHLSARGASQSCEHIS